MCSLQRQLEFEIELELEDISVEKLDRGQSLVLRSG